MPTIKKLSDGNYYFCTRLSKSGRGINYKDTFFIKSKETIWIQGKKKYRYIGGVIINIKGILYAPKELIGKRIRLKIEIVE